MSVESRFRHLERARPDEAPAGPDDARAERFQQVELERQPAPEAPPPLAAERFTDALPPAPSADSSLELARSSGQPFVRCCICGQDNNVQAPRCLHCSALLNTAEQRAYNERLWARTTDENRVQAMDQNARLALGQELAREVGAQTRRDIGLGSYGTGSYGGGPGIGWKLLSKLPDGRVAWAIAGAMIAVPVLLLFFGKTKSPAWNVGFFWAVVDAVLFLPRSAWRSRRWWW